MDEGFLGNIIAGLIDKNNNNDNCFGGGGAIWLILFVVLMYGGGFGFGNRANACCPPATANDVNNGFQFTQLSNDARSIERSVANSTYENLNQLQRTTDAINRVGYEVGHVGDGIQRSLDNVRYSASQDACGINRNIDAVRYQMAEDTCKITSTDTANTQKVLDAICQLRSDTKDNTIAQLRFDLQAAQLNIGNIRQTADVVNQLRPYPIPAYPVSSPYGTMPYGTTIV